MVQEPTACAWRRPVWRHCCHSGETTSTSTNHVFHPSQQGALLETLQNSLPLPLEAFLIRSLHSRVPSIEALLEARKITEASAQFFVTLKTYSSTYKVDENLRQEALVDAIAEAEIAQITQMQPPREEESQMLAAACRCCSEMLVITRRPCKDTFSLICMNAHVPGCRACAQFRIS